MYYLAILCPEEIDKKVVHLKNFFKEKYSALAALKSPAHITLIPPFWMKEELEPGLKECFNIFCASWESFNIQLENFSAFEPKTIFIGINRSEKLQMTQHDLHEFILSMNKFPIIRDAKPFHPHITLATRDLFKKDFHEAWKIFSAKKFEANWQANGISLLRHNKIKWDVIHTSRFANGN